MTQSHSKGITVDVWVVVPQRALLLDIAGPLEVLRRANIEQHGIEFKVRYVGVQKQVMSSIGLPLADIKPLPSHLPDDAMVLVPGTANQIAFANDVDTDIVRREENAVVAWLHNVIRPGHRLITICSGALLAARAGLLDGVTCTTHHSECEHLAALAPKAKVLDNRLFVVDGDRYTSAGVTAGTDLMLHIVSVLTDHGCALAVARHLVLYLRREGADPQISPWLQGRNHLRPAVHRVQDAIMADPAKAWTLTQLARVAHTSPRHLSRLFNEHAGMSVTAYVNSLRIALARELLQNSRLDMEHVAERSGFGSARQLRRAWSRHNESPPSEMRAIQP